MSLGFHLPKCIWGFPFFDSPLANGGPCQSQNPPPHHPAIPQPPSASRLVNAALAWDSAEMGAGLAKTARPRQAKAGGREEGLSNISWPGLHCPNSLIGKDVFVASFQSHQKKGPKGYTENHSLPSIHAKIALEDKVLAIPSHFFQGSSGDTGGFQRERWVNTHAPLTNLLSLQESSYHRGPPPMVGLLVSPQRSTHRRPNASQMPQNKQAQLRAGQTV